MKMTTEIPKDKKKTVQLAELTLGFAKAVELFSEGVRSGEEAEILAQALRLFGEGRLAGAMSKVICEAKEKCPGIAATDEGEDFLARLQKIFSVRVEESALPVDLRFNLGKMGIAYVGEIMMIPSYFRYRGKSHREFFREFLVSALGTDVNLSDNTEILRYWKPPYWNDSGLRKKLDQPISEVADFSSRSSLHYFMQTEVIKQGFPIFYKQEEVDKDYFGRRLWQEKRTDRVEKFSRICTIGELFSLRLRRRRPSNDLIEWRMDYLSNIQLALKPESCLHAGMLLPSDWAPPHRDEPLS
jgi:hypothetical protein